MMHAFMSKINDLSIRYKLFISYLVLIALPICLFLIINLYYSSRESEQRALYSLRQVMDQTRSILEFKTESIKNLLDVLAFNSTVEQMVDKSPLEYEDNVGSWMHDSQELSKIFYMAGSNPDVEGGIHLYMKAGLAAFEQTDEYILLDSVADGEWYKQFSKSIFAVQWFDTKSLGPADGSTAQGDYISAVKGVINSLDFSSISGIVRVDIPISTLTTTLEKSLSTKSTSAFLINSSRNAVCHAGPNLLNMNNRSISDMILNLTAANENGVWKTEKIDKESYLINVQSIHNTDWKLVLAVPYKDILELNVKTRNQMLFIFMLVIPLALPLSFIIAASSTKRIRNLISHMRKVERGDFNVSILPGSNDEIGQLIHNFNYMLTKMAMHVDEKFKLGREMKNLELKALQAQINPHFLYNTLDLIDWMSVRNNTPEISSLVKALSRFYKLSLSKGEDIVTVHSEIEHVKTYVQIQNMRFEDRIHLELDIPDEIYGYSILKIILQPLVENAILHGILEKEEESGTIRISCELSENILTFRIQDDGAGMTEEILQDIPSGITSNEAHGYGVRNINERIKLNYGIEYGLSYISEPGKGTTAVIRVPAIPIS